MFSKLTNNKNVRSLAQEAEFRLHAFLKMRALGRLAGLEMMSFEKTLHTHTFSCLQRTGIPDDLVGTWNIARRILSKELLDKPKTCDTLRAALSRRHEACTDIDASWEVDSAFFLSFIGELGEKYLSDLFTTQMPALLGAGQKQLKPLEAPFFILRAYSLK